MKKLQSLQELRGLKVVNTTDVHQIFLSVRQLRILYRFSYRYVNMMPSTMRGRNDIRNI